MPEPCVHPLGRRRLPRHVGEKIKNLQYLHNRGYSIPPTYAIPWDVQRSFTQNGGKFPGSLRHELEQIIDLQKTYAVRSSANVEDARSRSYAGQFLSVLDVSGVDNVLEAIRDVWNSAYLETPLSYQSHQKDGPDRVEMGVILQELIPARISGVAFSRNPMTGMDEIVVEAVEGSSVALLQDGVTPQRWIWKWGKWLDEPEKTDLPRELIEQIALDVREISSACGHPVDVEWVFDGQHLFWLQMRPITALESIDIYANHIPKEFLPGVIKPLVWTVNVPLVNGAWVRLLTELIGENQLDPLRLARSFYGYAYFNMGLLGSVFQKFGLPDNALERLMGFEAEGDNGPSFRPSIKAFRYLPRLIKFAFDKAWFDRKFESFIVQARERYAELDAKNLWDLTDNELVEIVGQLYSLNQQTAYFNIVAPLLMQLYHKLAKAGLVRRGVDYERINWLEGFPERADHDPVSHLRELGALYGSLDPTERERASSLNQEAPAGRLETFKTRLDAFMERFGHMSDNGNDFSYPSWRETPGVILNLIAGFADENGEQPAKSSDGMPPRGLFVRRAVRYSRYREQISFLYTRGVGMFRSAFQRIGDGFCRQGWLENVEDIFYLEYEEIIAALLQGEARATLRDLALERKNDHARYQSITLPPVIYGEHLPPILDQRSTVLTGIPTSRGLHRGVVCVVKGISDFRKVVDGCVLVIPYSDVSWAPLFARAGALVAESGGMLSHSSIIAREYGIPAIVSVPNATRLRDGLEVTVDGYTGNLLLQDAELEGWKNDE